MANRRIFEGFGDSAGWTARDARRAALVVLFLAVQLTLPVVALSSTSVNRFGWQMFSRLGSSQAFEAVYADGSMRPVDVWDLVAHPRPEVNWSETVHRHACADPEVLAVRYLDAAVELHELSCDR